MDPPFETPGNRREAPDEGAPVLVILDDPRSRIAAGDDVVDGTRRVCA
jgi:hypothetical protein